MLRRTVTNCSRLSESIELLDFDTVPETFYTNFAFAHRSLSLRSPCVLHSAPSALTVRLQYVHYVLSNRSAFAHRSRLIHLHCHSEFRVGKIICIYFLVVITMMVTIHVSLVWKNRLFLLCNV